MVAEHHLNPVFICGALRSGTTMLRLMIDHHPQLSNFGEADFLFEYPATPGAHGNVAAFKDKLSHDGLFEDSSLSLPDADNIPSFIRALVAQMRVPDKILTINIHRHFDQVPKVFPDSKVVHLLRDPRDVARSSIGMGWSGNVYHGVDHWIASERSMELMRERFPRTEVLTVKNEDLVRDPEVVLTRICAFIGTPYDPQMLDYHLNSTYAAPDKNLIEQWRSKLSERELGLVEGKLGEMLTDRGYVPSGAPVLIPDDAEKRALERRNRWGRFRETIRRYGLALTALELIGRRAGIDWMHEFARRRINQKHKDYLQ